MNRLIYIFVILSPSFIFVGIYIYFDIKKTYKEEEKKLINYTQKILDNSREIGEEDNMKLKYEDIVKDIKFYSGDLYEFLLDKYKEAIKKNDIYYQIVVLEKLYELKKDKDIIYYILEKALKINDFNLANKYVDKISGDLIKDKKYDIYFFVKFNNIKKLLDIKILMEKIDYYYKQGIISNEYYNFYKLLFSILLFDKDNFEKNINNLYFPMKYLDLIDRFKNSLKIYNFYKDSPEYYLFNLLAVNLFDYHFYGLANFIGKKSYIINEDYILTNQILAYTNFLLGNYDLAKKYIEKLLDVDYTNFNIYKFLLGIIYFWKADYSSSIIYFKQLEGKNISFSDDLYRYLALSYFKINDFTGSLKSFEKLYDFHGFNDYDYFTYFKYFLYIPYFLKKNEIFKIGYDFSKKTLKYCYKKLGVKNYICQYGYGGFLLNEGKFDLAVKYLKDYEQYLPYEFVYMILGKYYLQKKDYNNASKYFAKSLLVISDKQKREYILKKLKVIMKLK